MPPILPPNMGSHAKWVLVLAPEISVDAPQMCPPNVGPYGKWASGLARRNSVGFLPRYAPQMLVAHRSGLVGLPVSI